ncbi:hypothetical protein BVY04_05240 [bacterium M21]|nr:hypothetical protein BVY04_05240 [bacterium M21]
MAASEKLSASLEDYLETIYLIEQEKQAARAKDIVVRLGVSNASVTGALRVLGQKKLVNYAPYDLVTLTPAGRRLAQDVMRRHDTLKGFLNSILNVEEEAADEAACQLEHAISADILCRLTAFVEFAQEADNADWLKGLHARLAKPSEETDAPQA